MQYLYFEGGVVSAIAKVGALQLAAQDPLELQPDSVPIRLGTCLTLNSPHLCSLLPNWRRMGEQVRRHYRFDLKVHRAMIAGLSSGMLQR